MEIAFPTEEDVKDLPKEELPSEEELKIIEKKKKLEEKLKKKQAELEKKKRVAELKKEYRELKRKEFESSAIGSLVKAGKKVVVGIAKGTAKQGSPKKKKKVDFFQMFSIGGGGENKLEFFSKEFPFTLGGGSKPLFTLGSGKKWDFGFGKGISLSIGGGKVVRRRRSRKKKRSRRKRRR